MERNLHHKWALWIGIITHTVGFALLIVHRIIAPFYTSHYTPPPTDWVYLAMSCLAAPLLEELAFRFWTNEKNYGYFVSFLFSIVLLPLLCRNIWTTLGLAILLVPSYFLTKKRSYHKTVFIVISSLLFGIAHAFKFGALNPESAFVIIKTIGDGFILSFIAINFGILWSMAVHAIANTTLITISLLSGTVAVTIPTEGFDIHSHITFANKDSDTYSGDTMRFVGTLPSIARELALRSMIVGNLDTLSHHTRYRAVPSVHRYRIDMVKKKESFDYDGILTCLINNHLVYSDTCYAPSYKAHIESTTTSTDWCWFSTYYNYMLSRYGLYIIADEKERYFRVPNGLMDIGGDTFEQYLEGIAHQYPTIYFERTDSIKVITFSNY